MLQLLQIIANSSWHMDIIQSHGQFIDLVISDTPTSVITSVELSHWVSIQSCVCILCDVGHSNDRILPDISHEYDFLWRNLFIIRWRARIPWFIFSSNRLTKILIVPLTPSGSTSILMLQSYLPHHFTPLFRMGCNTENVRLHTEQMITRREL